MALSKSMEIALTVKGQGQALPKSNHFYDAL